MAEAPTHAELSAINERMVGQFLAQAEQPLLEGHYAVRVLESRGRATGQPRRTPLGLTQVDGNHYLVSPVLDRDWVRNLAVATILVDALKKLDPEFPKPAEDLSKIVVT